MSLRRAARNYWLPMLPMGEVWAVLSILFALLLVELSGWGLFWPCRGSARDVICGLSKRCMPLDAAPEPLYGVLCGFATPHEHSNATHSARRIHNAPH